MNKNVILTCAAVLFCTSIYAQNSQGVKLDKVVRDHNQKLANSPTQKVGKESGDAHFQRWLWYAKQHTDQSGHLVNAKDKYQYYKQYEASRSARKTSAASIANWMPLGANEMDTALINLGNGLGRINCVEFHPTNANTYYVGSVNGGVWKTINNGTSWTCISDNMPIMSVSDVDVNPMNPNTIYICTGDRDNPFDHGLYSAGVFKTVDGGANWSQVGSARLVKDKESDNCLVINPSDSNSLTLGRSDGIYKSYDGGTNWTQVVSNTHFKQLLYHPTDTSIIYASSFYDYNILDPAQVYRSTDGGASWVKITSLTNSFRIALAVSKSDPTLLMGVVVEQGTSNEEGLLAVIKSTNSGAGFSAVYVPNGCTSGNLLASNQDGTGCKGQGSYDVTLAISPLNTNNVFVGGVNAFYSTDGGTSWSTMNQWDQTLPGVSVVHADKHWMAFHPLVPARLFECNDGGISYTDAPASSSAIWTNVTDGMEITQFYRIGVANIQDTFVVGGAQDNSIYYIVDGEIKIVGTGDGTNAKLDMVDTIMYAMEQNGHFHKVDFNAATDKIISPGAGPWVTSFQISPFNNKHLVAGYSDVQFSTDQGDNWQNVSNGSIGAGHLSRVEMTPASNTTIYALLEGSDTVYYTHSFTPGTPANFNRINPQYNGLVTDIEVDPKDKDHFWLTYGGYGGPQFAEYKSGTWSQSKAGLPDVPVLCVRIDTNNRTLYIGTDVGVFFKEDTAAAWQAFDKGMPRINVTDIEINYVQNNVYAATYGRGVWISPRQRDTTTSIATVPFAHDVFQIVPNPNSGRFSIVAGETVNASETVKVTVMDYTGRVVFSSVSTLNNTKRVDVNLGDVPAGMYIVELSDQHVVIGSKRVVVR